MGITFVLQWETTNLLLSGVFCQKNNPPTAFGFLIKNPLFSHQTTLSIFLTEKKNLPSDLKSKFATRLPQKASSSRGDFWIYQKPMKVQLKLEMSTPSRASSTA
ncbi:hypothetical protein Droror1_Dr00021821 [Drosera rotundifolia]